MGARVMIRDCPTTPRRKLSPRERLAIFERCKGICTCGRKVQTGEKWQADHPRALGLGGADNPDDLVVLGKCCFPDKNAADASMIARAKRIKARHIGIRKPRTILGWRRFNGDVVRAPRER